jgi:hypothetical protein
MGAVGRQPSRLWCREQGLALSNVAIEGRDKDSIFGEGALSSWGVDVVIGAVAIVLSGPTTVTGGEGDDDVRGVGSQPSGGRHRGV